MTQPQADVQEKMKLLRESYLRQLPQKLCDIDTFYETLRKDPADNETARNLHRLAHSIKGSGASFGFKEVSSCAQSLQTFLQPFTEGGMRMDDKLLDELDKLINALMEAVGTHYRQRPEAADATPAPVSVDSSQNDENRLVYIVDGDSRLRSEISAAIRQFGYEPRGFSRCDELAKAIREKGPSAVILDFVRMEEDAAEAGKIISIRKELGGRVPAIFISDCDDVKARLEAVKAGSDAYFVKPLNIADLADKLGSLTTSRVSEPYKILVVDDEPELARYHSLLLREAGMVTEIVNAPLEIFDRLSEFGPDLILMDMYMPECDGMELAKTIRQMKTYFSIPIVFLSGETSFDKQMSAMIMGGDEFLTKPIKPEHLISAVAVRAERMRTMRSLMERDSLTGLLNHTNIKIQLDMAVARSERLNTPMAFAMIDIDRFKSVNDTYGHPVGDRVIVSLSRLLQQRLRKTDIIGRYGGEEFAIVLNEANVHDAKQTIDKILRSFSRIRFRHENKEFSVTFSSGVAGFPEFRDPETLSDAADKALYEAKRGGRNRIVIAPS